MGVGGGRLTAPGLASDFEVDAVLDRKVDVVAGVEVLSTAVVQVVIRTVLQLASEKIISHGSPWCLWVRLAVSLR